LDVHLQEFTVFFPNPHRSHDGLERRGGGGLGPSHGHAQVEAEVAPSLASASSAQGEAEVALAPAPAATSSGAQAEAAPTTMCSCSDGEEKAASASAVMSSGAEELGVARAKVDGGYGGTKLKQSVMAAMAGQIRSPWRRPWRRRARPLGSGHGGEEPDGGHGGSELRAARAEREEEQLGQRRVLGPPAAGRKRRGVGPPATGRKREGAVNAGCGEEEKGTPVLTIQSNMEGLMWGV